MKTVTLHPREEAQTAFKAVTTATPLETPTDFVDPILSEPNTLDFIHPDSV